MGLREVTATWEMLVKFKEAILSVSWPGAYVQAVGMGLEMIKQMEGQYRMQVEMARKESAEYLKATRGTIKKMGGEVNGEKEPSDAARVGA